MAPLRRLRATNQATRAPMTTTSPATASPAPPLPGFDAAAGADDAPAGCDDPAVDGGVDAVVDVEPDGPDDPLPDGASEPSGFFDTVGTCAVSAL